MHLSRHTKSFVLGLFLTTALSIAATSCKKDATATTSTDSVTESDAADAVTEAVTPESAGMVSQAETSVVIVNNASLSCGTQTDSAISGSNLEGAAVTYNYSLAWSSLMSCTNNIPSSYDFSFTGKFSYDAPRISSADSSTGHFTITGVQPGASNYVFTSSYERNGSEVSKVHDMRSFSSRILITSTDITVDKATTKILSGAATFAISGASSDGKAFSYAGTITFNGGETASLVFTGGGSYVINW